MVEESQTEKEAKGRGCKGDLHASPHQTLHTEETLPEAESYLGNPDQLQDDEDSDAVQDANGQDYQVPVSNQSFLGETPILGSPERKEGRSGSSEVVEDGQAEEEEGRRECKNKGRRRTDKARGSLGEEEEDWGRGG